MKPVSISPAFTVRVAILSRTFLAPRNARNRREMDNAITLQRLSRQQCGIADIFSADRIRPDNIKRNYFIPIINTRLHHLGADQTATACY